MTADEKMWNRISQIPAVVLVLLSGIDIVRFAILGDKTAFITFSMIAVVFMLVAYMAWKSRMPFLYLLIAAAAFILYFNTNFSTSTYYFNWLFLAEAIVATLGGSLGTTVMIWKKIPMGRVAVLPLAAAVLILAGFLGFWKVRYDAGHEAQGQARLGNGKIVVKIFPGLCKQEDMFITSARSVFCTLRHGIILLPDNITAKKPALFSQGKCQQPRKSHQFFWLAAGQPMIGFPAVAVCYIKPERTI